MLNPLNSSRLRKVYAKPTPTAEVARGLFEGCLRKGCKKPMRKGRLRGGPHCLKKTQLVLGPNSRWNPSCWPPIVSDDISAQWPRGVWGSQHLPEPYATGCIEFSLNVLVNRLKWVTLVSTSRMWTKDSSQSINKSLRYKKSASQVPWWTQHQKSCQPPQGKNVYPNRPV